MILSFIFLVLHFVVLFSIRDNLFLDARLSKPFKFPIFFYIGYFLLAFIPYFNIFMFIVWIVILIRLLVGGEWSSPSIYYKPGKIIKFLTKEL